MNNNINSNERKPELRFIPAEEPHKFIKAEGEKKKEDVFLTFDEFVKTYADGELTPNNIVGSLYKLISDVRKNGAHQNINIVTGVEPPKIILEAFGGSFQSRQELNEASGTGDHDDTEEVTIKLKKWEISLLLGSARLGIWVQDWCYKLNSCISGLYNTNAGRWIISVGEIINKIKSQTGINKENKYLGITFRLQLIEDIICTNCYKYLNERDKAKKENKAATKPMAPILAPTTEGMEDFAEARDFIERIVAEKR